MKTLRIHDLAVLGVVLCWSFTATATAAVLYVDGDTGDDANSGTAGWHDALATLNAAIDAASEGNEIWVKAGVYRPTTDTDRTKSFVMKDGVDLYGGFAGTETTREQRDWTNHVTILCGDIGVPGDHTENSYHVVVGANARIDGFTIRHGYADGAGANAYGGGMYLRFWTNTVGMISNCVFHANTVTGRSSSVSGLYLYDFGQKVWEADNAFQIVDTEFSNNMMLGNNFNNDANAVFVERFVAPVEFRDCRFIGNTNQYSVAARGSGALQINVHANGEGLRMTRCVFEQNFAANGAGAVVYRTNAGTNSVWRDCEFRYNRSPHGAGALRGGDQVLYDGCVFESNEIHNGGGGAISPGNSVFTNCTFRANFMTSSGYGGAVYLTTPATFVDCLFEDNVSLNSARGGGAFDWRTGTSTGLIENCTFIGNSAQGYGGAIWQVSGHLDLRGSTFISNSVSGFGRGGGAIYTAAGLTAEATDCVFEGNQTTGNSNAHGGAWWSLSPIHVRRSVFIANRTTGTGGRGGGLCFQNLSGEPGRVVNAVFRENTSSVIGGAIATLDAHVVISNVTAVANQSTTAGYGGALAHDSPGYDAEVINSIFWNNTPLEIAPTEGVTVRYSNIQGGFSGTGNLDVNPLFADEIYLHLLSTTAYYDDGYFSGGEWKRSGEHSLLIDAGDPASSWELEPHPHYGERINMGAYGNTPVASRSYLPRGTLVMFR